MLRIIFIDEIDAVGRKRGTGLAAVTTSASDSNQILLRWTALRKIRNYSDCGDQ